MNETHPTLGVSVAIPDDLRQRQIEAFYSFMRGFDPGWRELPLSEVAGGYARFAARQGWTNGLSEEAIPDAHPAAVRWIAQRVDRAIGEALAFPKA